MARYLTTIHVRFESERDELALDADIEARVWKAFADLVNDGDVDEVSHVDVDTEEED